MAGYKRSKFAKYTRRARARRMLGRFRRRVFRSNIRRIVYGVAINKYYETFIDVSNGSLYAKSSLVTGAFNNLTAATFSGCSLINAIPQGYAQGQRVGEKITIKYIQLALYFNNSMATTVTNVKQDGMFCRYGVFLDKRASNTTAKPIWDGVLWDTQTSATGTALFPFAFKNFDTLSRFKTLVDGQHRSTLMTSDATNPSLSGTGIVQHFIRLNKRFTYSKVSTNTTGDAMYDQDVWIQAIPSAATCCALGIAVRVCFNDC